MRALVTGGGGYIGSVIVRLLCDKGVDVTVLDNFESGYESNIDPRAGLIRCDLRNRADTVGHVKNGAFGAVFHMASSIVVSESQKRPLDYYENNLLSTFNLLSALKGCGIERFIFSSTAAVYSDKAVSPINENALLEPSSCYGSTKLACEDMVRWAAQESGYKATIFRYFNAAGGYDDLQERHEPETHLIPLILKAHGAGENMLVYGSDYPTPDGSAIRDYIHVYDIAKAHLLALDHDGPESIFNLGTEKGISVLEVLSAAEQTVGASIKREFAPRRSGDAAILIADASKARDILKWIPQRSDIQEIISSVNIDQATR